jgi:rRNA maturation endonuclease Nob1
MKFIMNNTEPLNSKELIQHAKEIVLLDSNLTIKCIHCKTIFPKENDICPQYNTN